MFFYITHHIFLCQLLFMSILSFSVFEPPRSLRSLNCEVVALAKRFGTNLFNESPKAQNHPIRNVHSTDL